MVKRKSRSKSRRFSEAEKDVFSQEWEEEVRTETTKKGRKDGKKKKRRSIPSIVVSASNIDITPRMSDFPVFKSKVNVSKGDNKPKVPWFTKGKVGQSTPTEKEDELPSLKSLTPSEEQLKAPPSSYGAISDEIVVFDEDEINFFFNSSPHSSVSTNVSIKHKSIGNQFENFYAGGDEELETRITNRLVVDYSTVPPGKVYREWLPQMVDNNDVYHVLQDIPGCLKDVAYFDRGINWLKHASVIVISPAAEMKKHFWTVKMTFENMYTITANSNPTELFYIGETYNKFHYNFLKGSHPMELYLFDFNCRVNMYMVKKMHWKLFCYGGHGSIPHHKIETWANGSDQQSTVFEVNNTEDKTTPLWIVADDNKLQRLTIQGPKGILRFFYRPKWEEKKKMEFTVYKMDGKTKVGKIFRKPRDDSVMLSSSWSLVISCDQDLRPNLKCGLISAAMLFRQEYMETKRFGRSKIRYTGSRICVTSLVLFFIIIVVLVVTGRLNWLIRKVCKRCSV